MSENVNVNQYRKEKHEWATMMLFRSSYSSFPLGEIEKSECPDFLVHTKKGLLGIELTELKYDRQNVSFNPRGHEKWLESIMEAAQAEFERSSELKLVVDVHFLNELGPTVSHPKEEPSLLLHDGLKETILKIVNENTPEATGQQYIIDRTSKYGYLNLPSIIEAIYVKNVTGRYAEGLWYAGISTMVKPLSVESVGQRIADKNLKISHYNQQCERMWLMIIQNSFLMSSLYDPQMAYRALHHRYLSLFDRVFVFERSEGHVTELPIIRIQK
ncbi:MAG: hypothetical protein MJZ23_05585 [Paludibacteraceae bacterium]|nr:hypothetical protein [Paludibacteraceae bacterium]